MAALVFAVTPRLLHAEPIDIGDRLELFVDDYLIVSLDGVKLRLHPPVARETVLTFDRPYEGRFCGYITVIHDANRYRMYYRGLPDAGKDGSDREVTCYAESPDGLTWTKPDLGLFDVNGSRHNNIILADAAPFSHNFSPFLDTRPGVAANERYKALAGTSRTGLHGFVSADGIRWRKLDGPLISEGAFDSQNVAFWSEHEQRYVAYVRTWSQGEFDGYRSISRAVSDDFRTWSAPKPMTFGGTPMEHLYTNQTEPYFRAPHFYIALPMRFMPGRRVLTAEEAERLGVYVDDSGRGYAGDSADAVFMTSRGGTAYDRTFMEAFIRPGQDLGNWASRAGMVARGVVPTGPGELSIYKQAHYAQPSAHLVRYTLRTDGFASVHAGYDGGRFTTKPLVFSGSRLVLNFSTSAAGGIRAAIADPEGNPIPGFTLDDCDEVIGDRIAYTVTWNGDGDLSSVAGRPVVLTFTLHDADLYSLRFAEAD